MAFIKVKTPTGWVDVVGGVTSAELAAAQAAAVAAANVAATAAISTAIAPLAPASSVTAVSAAVTAEAAARLAADATTNTVVATKKPIADPPLAHKASHAVGGTDALSPTDIGVTDPTAALALKVNTSAVGAASGVAPLGADSKVPSANLPASTGGVASVVAGTNVAVDATDPAHPVVSSTQPADAAAGTASLRTLGTGVLQAASGADARFAAAEQLANKNVAGGYVGLDAGGHVQLAGKQSYGFTGADQSWTVPAGVTSVSVAMIGGGGGGAGAAAGGKGAGGNGAGVTGVLAVTPGQVVTIMVGSGGRAGSLPTSADYGGGGSLATGGYGGQGGGRSAIRVMGVDLLTAGAGGGGASSSSAVNPGGDGGGPSGSAGTGGALAGGPGTQSAAGAGGAGPTSNGLMGTKYFGGNGVLNGASGGSGWYGGGSGGYNGSGPNVGGGGGGGSSYFGGAGVTNGAYLTYAQAAALPGMSGAGAGGAANTNGQSGIVVLTWFTDPLATKFDISGTPTYGQVLISQGGTSAAGGAIPPPSTATATGAALAATCSAQTGAVTTEALTTAAAAKVTYTVTNTICTANSKVFVSVKNGTNTAAGPVVVANVNALSGSFKVDICNLGAAALNGTLVLSFWVTP